MPPKLSSVAPDTLHNVVTKGMMAVLGLGALSVLLDPSSVKSYDNEVEYAKANKAELRGRKPHRCNDRVEDFVQVCMQQPLCMHAHPHSPGFLCSIRPSRERRDRSCDIRFQRHGCWASACSREQGERGASGADHTPSGSPD